MSAERAEQEDAKGFVFAVLLSLSLTLNVSLTKKLFKTYSNQSELVIRVKMGGKFKEEYELEKRMAAEDVLRAGEMD